MNKNLLQRIITGILGGSLLITLTYIHPLGLWLICTVLMLLSYYEWLHLLDSKPLKMMSNILILSILLISNFLLAAIYIWKNPSIITYCFVGFLLFPLLSLLSLREKNLQLATIRFMLQITGIVYIVLPWFCYFTLAWYHGEYNWKIPLGIQFLHWMADTAAYFCGKIWGKTKLLEHISPGKTFEGFGGGIVGTLLLAWLLQNQWYLSNWNWIYIGIMVSTLGVGGDLFESLIKRSYTLKDSSNILPGHGGVLDRFDGFLLTLPIIYVYAQASKLL
ncbi:MAG: phosphatidate cytidylyltransferase [Bacteroidia bacterium]|nr:phosphatidate cytidylyltransferase [Bacteroidia bacterium]MDW8159244.1 phosphatidate cytidylyltransferase [Bacteroidia bacterium]